MDFTCRSVGAEAKKKASVMPSRSATSTAETFSACRVAAAFAAMCSASSVGSGTATELLLRLTDEQNNGGDQCNDADGKYDGGGHHEDRKSTRLNSSHVAISYAV